MVLKIHSIQYSTNDGKILFEIDTSDWSNEEFIKKYNMELSQYVISNNVISNNVIPNNVIIKTKYDITPIYRNFHCKVPNGKVEYLYMQNTYNEILRYFN